MDVVCGTFRELPNLAPTRNDLLVELARLIALLGGQGEVHTAVPGLVLSAFSLPTEPADYVAEPGFAVVAQGGKRVMLGDQIFDYSAGQYLVYSVDLPLSAYVSKASQDGPLLGLGLTLKPEAIASLLLETGVPTRRSGEQRGIAVGDVTADLLEPIVRLVRLLERPTDIPILAPVLEREILWRLVNGEHGSMVRQLGLADSRMTRIGRAIRWLRTHYHETVRLRDLTALAGMSLTAFHRNFRAATGMSPIQFQKHLRLTTARARLLSTTDDAAEVGFAVGYESPSQFSREYRRQFGRPPGQDSRMLRGVGTA